MAIACYCAVRPSELCVVSSSLLVFCGGGSTDVDVHCLALIIVTAFPGKIGDCLAGLLQPLHQTPSFVLFFSFLIFKVILGGDPIPWWGCAF